MRFISQFDFYPWFSIKSTSFILENMSELIENECLISLIKERPVLWDKTLDIYKDRTATKNAWREVFKEMRADFEGLEERERKSFGREVMKRWKNIRDYFLKIEKKAKIETTSGSRARKRRKYFYKNELQFLKKIYLKANATESFIMEEENKTESDASLQQPCETKEPETSQIFKAKEKTQLRGNEKLDEVDLKISEKSANPQMSFFHSLLPHTENFDGNQWLQFQLEVLRVISNIKNQRTAALHYQGNIAQLTSPLQQQSQAAAAHYPQLQTFLQPTFTIPSTSSHSQSPPPIPLVIISNPVATPSNRARRKRQAFATQTSTPSIFPFDPSSSKSKANETPSAEHCTKNVAVEDSDKCSSVDSSDSSTTIDIYS